MSSASWPPQLKDWVAKCLGQMTDSNRVEAQEELRKVIADAFAAQNALDDGLGWDTIAKVFEVLHFFPATFLLPKQPMLKRKSNDLPTSNKKAKKSALKQASNHSSDFNNPVALNRRAQRFQREHEIERQKSLGGNASLKANQQYAHLNDRPTTRPSSPYVNSADDPDADPNVIDWDRYTIVGSSQELFKDYLRLTSEPKPEQIRPYAVLQQTLLELKKRWREKCSYSWICNQFKSLRQDLTVQRIKNDFTVQVYEIHARMALESNDMVEFNQCQATLKTLYELGIPGKQEEFTAYRILMLLHGRNRSELNLYVGQLTPRQKSDSAVKHALDVQKSLAMGNYHALFRLYLNAPNMGGYIMDHLIGRERAKALMTMTKAYKTLPLSFIHSELAFDDIESAHKFLTEHSSSFFTNPNSPDTEKILDCRPILPNLTQAYEEKYRKVGIRGAI